MKIDQIKEGVGRITKQNQTADVGPDEVKTQAAKFGNSVDKDGRPPTLSKKVKGSKTNVLFNLGMSERFTPMEMALMEGGHSIEDYYKANEDETELSQESEIYVDMDGVLADFFGAWKKLIGKDWRNIDDIDDALQRIRDKDDFWLKIPKTNNAMNLLGLVKKLKGKYNILSAPLANDPNSEPHKREWIKKHLKAFPPNKVIITADKAKYATTADGTPNILIDDFGQNVNKWVAAGGVGFKHKDHKFERTVQNLAKHLAQPAKENYARAELPQIGKKELKDLWHTKESVAVKDIIPVQKERIQENYAKQLRKIASGNYAPIVVDCENKIINGHHRYDIIKKLTVENVTVIKLPLYLENLVEITRRNLLKGLGVAGAAAATGAKVDVAKAFSTPKDVNRPGYVYYKVEITGPNLDGKVEKNFDSYGIRDEEFLKKQLQKKFGDEYEYKVTKIKNPSKKFKLDPKKLEYFKNLAKKLGSDTNARKVFEKKFPNMSNQEVQAYLNAVRGIKENFAESKVNFTMPNFDFEWEEANRYEQYRVLGKEKWIELAKTGKAIDVDNRMANDIENTEAGEEYRYDYWDGLVKTKRDRFTKALSSGQIELPIIARYSDGQMELISGNTRLTGMMRELGRAKAWVYEVPDEVADLEENFADGKKKGKSRPGRVKRSGASCNGSVTSLRKRAKNASGEKAKMYHWCANMKSGRKKGK